ncbi:rho GTPase-activating protein 27 isoform X2 [Mixophyes fleayi]|uniref:rho GTPase-activating protein 27 isoform X2 n=1 Tax=Mixophyes fleayi TaxID=3061075 RepID=UPI003F4D928D
METAASLEKDYVLVEHEFEYTTKDGRVISIKPHERYILLKRTNEHWWHVCHDSKTKPFYIPAKYVKVLSSTNRSSNGIEFFQDCSDDLIEHEPNIQYSYTFLPVDPQPSVGIPPLPSTARNNATLSGVQKTGSASMQVNATSKWLASDVQQLSSVRSGASQSLLDLSVVSENAVTETVQIISQDKTGGGRPLGPLRTFHNSKKILDPQKRISFMSPLNLETSIRPTQSLNDLQFIKSETPTSYIQQPEITNIPEIRFHMEELSIQQINTDGSDGATSLEKAVIEEEDQVHIYANLEEFRKDSTRQRSSSQQHSSTSTIEEWETHTDKGSGQLFYYNSVTGETTWDCPFDQAEDQLHSPFSLTSLSPVPGEAEWEKHFDEASGQFYFYNSVTGETSWDPPLENELHLPGVKPMFPPHGSANRRPPTPEADYPDYCPEEIENYPQTDYDGLYVPPPPHKSPSDDHISGWYCQVKDGQKLYTNSYNGDMWLQSQDKYGKTYFHTPDGSISMWNLPQLGAPDFQKGSSDPDQNSNILTSLQHNFQQSLQKETETKGLEKAGVLHKAKIAENGKRLRKNWSSSWTVLEGGILTFFKDTKNLSSNSLKQSVLATSEHTLKLQGASLSWATKEKSSKKHVMELKTRDGAEYLIHHDSETITTDWFTSISKCIGKTVHVSSEYTSENETESLQEFGSTEKLGIKDEKEKKNAGLNNNNSDSDRNVRAKLKKFLQRRPTLQSLRDKGYIRDQVFGCPLHELCEREKRNVPEFVSKSIEVVEKRGLDIDGLYRVSGNLAVIQKLRYKVDHDENFNLDDGRWEDVHVITGALKLFFRELPEPLFPYSHFDKFIEAIRLSDQNQKIRRLKELVLSLPSSNLETMRLLFRHLCSVIDHKESNRMSVQSVAIVFGPTLLKPEVEAGNIAMYMVFQNQIVEQILIQYKYIFTNS